jgi:hypothetical protein
MFKKILIILTPILAIIILIISSIFFPKPFLSKPLYYNISYELKQFSLTNPEYVSYQFDDNNQRYNIFFTKMTRNKFWQWDINEVDITKSIVLKDDLDNFKTNLKKNILKTPTEIIQTQPEVFVDKYEILPADSFEEREYKRAWHPPGRENSPHYNLDKFKLLVPGEKWPTIEQKIGKADFGLSPERFYPDYYRMIYNIGSKKISFAFVTFKENYPFLNEETFKFPLVDIVLITQRQEMVKVPVNTDGTYNWELIKDKID